MYDQSRTLNKFKADVIAMYVPKPRYEVSTENQISYVQMYAHFTVELLNYMVAFVVSQSKWVGQRRCARYKTWRMDERQEWETILFCVWIIYIWTVPEMCRCSPFLFSFFFFFLNGRVSAASLALKTNTDSTKDRIIPSAAKTFRHGGNLLIAKYGWLSLAIYHVYSVHWCCVVFIVIISNIRLLCPWQCLLNSLPPLPIEGKKIFNRIHAKMCVLVPLYLQKFVVSIVGMPSCVISIFSSMDFIAFHGNTANSRLYGEFFLLSGIEYAWVFTAQRSRYAPATDTVEFLML